MRRVLLTLVSAKLLMSPPQNPLSYLQAGDLLVLHAQCTTDLGHDRQRYLGPARHGAACGGVLGFKHQVWQAVCL